LNLPSTGRTAGALVMATASTRAGDGETVVMVVAVSVAVVAVMVVAVAVVTVVAVEVVVLVVAVVVVGRIPPPPQAQQCVSGDVPAGEKLVKSPQPRSHPVPYVPSRVQNSRTPYIGQV
jgi:hypothetical protein